MITSVLDYVRQMPAKPWLLVGKGPTMDHCDMLPIGSFNVLTLNHACKVVRPDIAHFVDVDALTDCFRYLKECRVAVPWHPHVEFRPSTVPLDEYLWAGELGDRLLSYNATTIDRKHANKALPTVILKKFSAVAAFNILLDAGVRHIFTIGVDGGTGYSTAFDHKTRLANGQKSFDVQTPLILEALSRCKAQWTKLPV